MLGRMWLSIRRWRLQSFRLNLQRAEERSSAVFQQSLVCFELDVSGSKGSEHVCVLRVNVPDGGGDVLPEGWPEKGIVAGGWTSVEEVHVHNAERAFLLAEQGFQVRALE